MAAHSAAASGPREPSFEVYPAGTKFWLDGAYVGEFGDPFVEDTELEGNRSVPSLKVMVKLVTALAAMAEAHGWRMDPARLRDAAACMDEGTVAGSGDTVRDQVIDLHSRLVNLKAGGCLMLPSGWLGTGGGHAIMSQWHRREDGDFDFVVINSGEGLEHHPQRKDARGEVFKSVMRFSKIPAERATDTAILWVNRQLYHHPSKGHTPQVWYAAFLGSLLQTDQVTALAPTFCVDDDALDGDWMTPQRAGVCYFRCVLISFKYFLRSRGASYEEVKRTTVYLRLMFVLAAKHSVETLGNCPVHLGPAALSQSDLMLLRVGLHQTAHHTLKAVRRGHLTSSEAGWIEHTLSEFEEKLLPSCVIAGWADTGPPPVRFISDAGDATAGRAPPGKVLWSPVLAGSAAKLLTFDPKFDDFCGGEAAVESDANLVLSNVMAGVEFRASTGGLHGTLANAIALANMLAAGSGGVTPAAGKQLAMEVLFDVVCCKLPTGLALKRAALGLPAVAGDGSAEACWAGVPVGSAAFSRGVMTKDAASLLAKDAHEVMCLVLALWRASPNLEGQGIAMRNLTVIAAAQLLDACLRYAAPCDGGFLSSRLRGTVSRKVLDQVDGASRETGPAAGPDKPARLAFVTPAGATLAEATAALEASRPGLGEARRRVCEYDAIVTRDCALAMLGLDSDPSAGAGAGAGAAAAASSRGRVSGAAPHAATCPPTSSVAAAEHKVGIALYCDFRTQASKSIRVESDAPLLVEAEAAARCEEYPVVSDASLQEARELMKSATLTRAGVPPLVARSRLLMELSGAEFGLGLSTNILLQVCLEPADHAKVCPPCDELASAPGTACALKFDKDLKVCDVTLSVGSLSLTSKDIPLLRSVPLSPCDPRMHGVAARGGPQAPADEDDVMLAVRLDSFGDVLTPDESERLLALLTTETLRVPLALDFFGDSLVGALFDADLRQLLWNAVFELRDLAVKPASHGEPLPVTAAPASSPALLATPRGPLWYELRHCPASTLGALSRLIKAASKLCGAGSGNTFFITLLFIARLTARVLQTATAVLQDGSPDLGHESVCSTGAARSHHAGLAAERTKVLLVVASDLEPALEAHRARAQAKFWTENLLAIRLHVALLRLSLLPGELTSQAIADVLGSVALARVLHSFGAQAGKPFTMSKWRARAPKPLLAGRTPGQRAAVPPGLEPPWMRAAGGIRMTEHNVAEMTFTFRNRLVTWLASATPSQRSEALTMALRIVQQNDSSNWDAGESLPCGSRPKDDLEMGVYQGAGGHLLFLAQTFELRSTSGSAVQPVPETTAHHGVFKLFFGRGEVPYCTVVARQENCTRLSILGSPSLAAYGSLEVEHWTPPSDESSSGKAGDQSTPCLELLQASGYPAGGKGDLEWLGVKHTRKVFSGGALQGSFRSALPWAAEVLDECVIGEFREAATIPKCDAEKLEPHKEAIAERAARAQLALRTMSIFAPSDVESLADASSISLLCSQPESSTQLEIVLHKSTCAAGAGTGGIGWAEVFCLDEFARRVFRRPIYCSDVRRSLFCGNHATQPLEYALSTAPPAPRMFRGGDITRVSGFGSSIAVYRTRSEPSEATVAVSAARIEADPGIPPEPATRALFVPVYMLRGVLPGALLDLPLMWWLRKEADGGTTLLGEPVPARANAGAGGDEPDSEPEGAATEDGTAGACRVMVIARVVGTEVGSAASGAAAAAAASARAASGARWPGLQITLHHLYHGMRTPGPVGAAARALFGRDHAALSEPPHSPGPARLLHDMSDLTAGTALASLRDSVVRAESASHALAWSLLSEEERGLAESSTAPAVLSGGARSLWAVELPRLETSLEARPSKASPGGVRFFVSDRDGLFLNEDEGLVAGWDADAGTHPVRPAQQVEEETTVGVRPLGLLAGLPHALVLRGGDGSAHLLVPSHPLIQQFVADAPFSTFVAQARGTSKWTWSCARKTFLLSVSVSEGFLRVPSLAAALYLVQCLVAHRHYSRASRVLRSVDTDKPLSGTEQFLLTELGRFQRDNTPDMAAIRCQLCLCLRYVRSIRFPWVLANEVAKVLGLREHVRSMCQLTHEQAASLLEMTKGNEVDIAMHRGFTKGATTKLASSSRVQVASRLESTVSDVEQIIEKNLKCLRAARPVPESELDQICRKSEYWDELIFERKRLTSLDDSEGQKWLAGVMTNHPRDMLKTLIRLSVGDTTFDLGCGHNAGRRFAPVVARIILASHSLAAGYGRHSEGRSFPFLMAFAASQVNATGTRATLAGEHSGFPTFWDDHITSATVNSVNYVREVSAKVLAAYTACGGQGAFVVDRRAQLLPSPTQAVMVTPDMAPPQPPPISGTTPLEPLILCGTLARGEAEKEAPASRIVRAAQQAARGALDPAGVALAAAAVTKEDVAAFGGRPLFPLMCEVSAERGHGMVVALTAEERGVPLPAPGLPFEAAPAGGEPMPASFVASSMRGRLEASCGDWHARVKSGTEEQLRCLVLPGGEQRWRLPTRAEMADAAFLEAAIGDLDALAEHLQALFSAEVSAVRVGVPAVLAVANGLSAGEAAASALRLASAALGKPLSTSDTAASLAAAPSALADERSADACVLTSLERLAGHRAPVSDDMLLAASLSASREADLTNANPMLAPNRARSAVEAAGAMMLRANRASQCSFCLGQSLRLLSQLQAIRASSTTPGEIEHGAVIRAGAALASSLVARRHYASTLGGTLGAAERAFQTSTSFTMPGDADEARLDPRFLVFEFLNGWLLRREQVEIVTQFVREMGVDVLGLPEDVDKATTPNVDAENDDDDDMELEIGEEGLDIDLDLDDMAGAGIAIGDAKKALVGGKGVRGKAVSRITQARMGMGKTACVSPLCCLFMANGQSIVAQVVPSALLAQTQTLLSEIFAQVIPKRVVTLDFDRTRADDPVALRQLYEKIAATRRDRGVLITTASALKSMALLFVEELGKAMGSDGVRTLERPSKERERHFAAAGLMAETLDVFGERGQGRLLLDEVDMLFSPLTSELNFPISDTVLIGPRPERWSLPVAMVAAVHAATAAVSQGASAASARPGASAAAAGAAAGKDALAALAEGGGEDAGPIAGLVEAIRAGLSQHALQVSPHLVLLEQRFYHDTLVGSLADWAAWWLKGPAQVAGEGATQPGSDELAAAVASRTPRSPAVLSVCRGLPERGRRLVALARQWVTGLLPHALTKINRVTFGLLTGAHASSLAPGTSRTRLLTSVPFVGLDVPSPVSEHAHPDVLIGLTALAYAYEGLQLRHLHEVGRTLKQAMAHQVGAISQRPARQLWSRWCRASAAAWREQFGAVADAVKAQRQAEQIPSPASTGALDDAMFREASLGEPEVPELELLQMDDAEQARDVFRLLGRHAPTARWFLNTTVFPFVCNHREAKLSASGQELGTDMLFAGRCGFSGTPNDLIPLELGSCDFEPGSEGQFLSTLTDPSVVSIDTTVATGMLFKDAAGSQAWSVRALLKALATADPPYHALIDCGALITGMSNEDTAWMLLREGLPKHSGVVFLNEANAKMVAIRGRTEAVPLSECGLPFDKRLTIYDQCHTTGMDIKQAPAARALLTIGKDNTLRDVFQAAWRMRGIGKGQTVNFLVTPEVASLIQRNRGARAFASEDLLQGLFGWLLRNSIRIESLMFSQLCKQDMAHTWRRSAFRDMQAIMGGVDPACAATPGLPIASEVRKPIANRGVREAILPALKVFRESVSFSVPDPLAEPASACSDGGGLAAAADFARCEHPRFVRSKDEERFGIIVRRSKSGSGEDDAAAEAGLELGSEMVQEQEAEAEVEQEEDAERESELAQWFNTPDVAIPMAESWSIADLGRVGSGDGLASVVAGSYRFSSWKPGRACPSPVGMPAAVLASPHWCPQDISGEPEFRIKLAAAVLTIGGATGAGPAGILLSLAEAEAIRRAFHTRVLEASLHDGAPSPGLWLVRSSKLSLLDFPGAAASERVGSGGVMTQLPETSAVAAAALFSNNEVWVNKRVACTLLDALSGLSAEERLLTFETVMLRRRERRRAWQATPMRDVFTLPSSEAARRRDVQLAELACKLRASSESLHELFAAADSHRSGRLGPAEVASLAAAVGLSVTRTEASALSGSIAALTGRTDSTVTLAALAQLASSQEHGSAGPGARS
ncbi:hypothetical protein FNF27_03064 [Cafeteria roenbergensis]|uniref:ubiquitinyl hydrolase 1 n=1 Tax=Cafeteria roenbergensis TaxID=33653 RepID=A0A5A8EBR0_CAFRO|nr:hypothetical protein FNF27_03064 [Cafeteria roenbergensis]